MVATKQVMTIKETMAILFSFHDECVKYWLHEGKPHSEAMNLALQDIEGLSTNPYDPNGDWLDQEAKLHFMEYMANM